MDRVGFVFDIATLTPVDFALCPNVSQIPKRRIISLIVVELLSEVEYRDLRGINPSKVVKCDVTPCYLLKNALDDT